MTVGILALQGAFIEHQQMLKTLYVNSFLIRTLDDLNQQMDGIILPGGESTAIFRLLNELNMTHTLKQKITDGLPVLGTCAGLILLAEDVIGQPPLLGLLPVTVKRNAYGRQLGSFMTKDLFNGHMIPMTFIRAPYVTDVKKDVHILSGVAGQIVAVRYQNMLATAFHPELSDSTTVLSYFLEMIKKI